LQLLGIGPGGKRKGLPLHCFSLNGLTYNVNADTNPAVALDQPCFLVGQGAVSLLDTAPVRLFFSSGILQNAAIRILVGRDATP